MLNRFKDFDFYRKIPKDLTESSAHGNVLSICAAIFMLILFIAEFWAFLSVTHSTNIVVDSPTNSQMRINFNITVMNMPCEFATIDVVDVLGTRNDNVTVNINKWQVDEKGVKMLFEGRNVEQKDLEHDTHHNLEALHANGIHAVPVDTASFDAWLEHYQYTFVNYYAPWCIWCQRLEPVWEAFAERIEREHLPVSIVKVDCVANAELCTRFKIQAFPTLKWFKGSELTSPDYRSDRTVEAMLEFAKGKLAMDEQVAMFTPEEKDAHEENLKLTKDDHPGCLMVGTLMVNRVPGHFHIEARSKHHNLNPTAADVSHIINSFSFGPSLNKAHYRKLETVPPEFFQVSSTKPMDGRGYKIEKPHQAFHHYIKVVPTTVEFPKSMSSRLRKINPNVEAFQMVASSQVMQYDEDEIPEARFTYDISPMSVVISTKGKRWYEFVTSMCALIGGTFTVVGLLSSFLTVIFKPKKI